MASKAGKQEKCGKTEWNKTKQSELKEEESKKGWLRGVKEMDWYEKKREEKEWNLEKKWKIDRR